MVFDYDNIDMYLAMVEDNREYAQKDIKTRLNEVEQGKALLTPILDKCKTLQDVKRHLSFINLRTIRIKTDRDVAKWRGQGIGAPSILALLNKKSIVRSVRRLKIDVRELYQPT